MKLINLTPHDVTVVSDDGAEKTITYPRTGTVARAAEQRTLGHPLTATESIGTLYVAYTGVENLPDPEPGVGYIVSVLTVYAAKATGRTVADLYYPGDLVRDIAGAVIGCRALYQVADTAAQARMLSHRARLLDEHPEVTEAADLAPLMGEHEGEYWRWILGTSHAAGLLIGDADPAGASR